VSNLKLEEWEVVCNKCEGSGKSWIYTTPCTKCQGKGKVDWIENIVGKKYKSIGTSGSNDVFVGYQAGLSKTIGSETVIKMCKT
jgi:DnaJ-class molecular chaperone